MQTRWLLLWGIIEKSLLELTNPSQIPGAMDVRLLWNHIETGIAGLWVGKDIHLDLLHCRHLMISYAANISGWGQKKHKTSACTQPLI